MRTRQASRCACDDRAAAAACPGGQIERRGAGKNFVQRRAARHLRSDGLLYGGRRAIREGEAPAEPPAESLPLPSSRRPEPHLRMSEVRYSGKYLAGPKLPSPRRARIATNRPCGSRAAHWSATCPATSMAKPLASRRAASASTTHVGISPSTAASGGKSDSARLSRVSAAGSTAPIERERPDGRAHQRRHHRAGANSLGQVATQRTDVRARAAFDVELQLGIVVAR